MKLRVTGPRVLIQVKKYNKKKDHTFEGSMIVMAEETADRETTAQTTGIVLQLGSTAYKRKDSGCDGNPWCKEGDLVHFSRYGAQRINPQKCDDYEYWVLNDKDVLVVEEAEDNVLQ